MTYRYWYCIRVVTDTLHDRRATRDSSRVPGPDTLPVIPFAAFPSTGTTHLGPSSASQLHHVNLVVNKNGGDVGARVALFAFATPRQGHLHEEDAMLDGRRRNKQNVPHGASDRSWNLSEGPAHLSCKDVIRFSFVKSTLWHQHFRSEQHHMDASIIRTQLDDFLGCSPPLLPFVHKENLFAVQPHNHVSVPFEGFVQPSTSAKVETSCHSRDPCDFLPWP
jgi:hypothetical protein